MPLVGQSVLLAGLPGVEKTFPRSSHVDFGKYLAMAAVSCVSELDFSIIVPPNSELIATLGLGFPPRQYNMGGMSGGPLAIVTDGRGYLPGAYLALFMSRAKIAKSLRRCRLISYVATER
jgi:hypothetical protein